MSTELDALAYRISHLEALVNELQVEPTTQTVAATTQAESSGGQSLVIIQTPVTLYAATGYNTWTTVSSSAWPSNATHVYLEARKSPALEDLWVRKDSTCGEYAIVGGISANNVGGETVGCAFAELTTSSTFDFWNDGGGAFVLRVIGYMVPVS